MTEIGAWVGPTIAISLLVIALCVLVMTGVMLSVGLGLRKQSHSAGTQLAVFSAEVKAVTSRLKGELEGFADLSSEARAKVRGAIDTVDGRLKDLDALVEVLQEEAEATALDVAAFVRTVRRSSRIVGAARALSRSRRKSRE